MIFFFKSDGTLIKSAPETVYQGSAEAGKVYVVAPLNANMLVDVYYELPNGERWGAYLLENNGTVINNEELPDGWALWSTTLESAITQYAGTLKAQFGFYQSGTADKVPLITSQGVTITIAKGVVRDLPSAPTADVYAQIVNDISSIKQDIANLPNEYLSNTNEDKIALKNNKVIEYSENATAGTIVKRDSDGKINVADGTEDLNAVNVRKLNAELETKVTRVPIESGYYNLYGESHDGQIAVPFAQNTGIGTIPQRTTTGQLKAADGVADDDLATVKQLNAVQGNYTDITNIDLNAGDTTVEYDTELGITVNAKGTLTHKNGAAEQPTTKFELPIIAGEGISIDKAEKEEKIVIKAEESNSNLQDGAGKNSLQQKDDPKYNGVIKAATKNPYAKVLYPDLTDEEPIGASGDWASAFGGNASAQAKRSFAGGTSSVAKGAYSKSTGDNTVSTPTATDSTAEGYQTTTDSPASHSEGSYTVVMRQKYVEGMFDPNADPGQPGEPSEPGTTPTDTLEMDNRRGEAGHAEGFNSYVSGFAAKADGVSNVADGHISKSSGRSNRAWSYLSKTDGYQSVVKPDETDTTATGEGSWANGNDIQIVGAMYAYAGGQHGRVIATAHNSFSYGYCLVVEADSQAVFGKYNVADNISLFMIGAGTDEEHRKTIMRALNNGQVLFSEAPTNPESPIRLKDFTDDYYPASKAEIAKLALRANDFTEAGTIAAFLKNKVDKTEKASNVYGTNSNGEQVSLMYSVNAAENTIPYRDKNGFLKTATPTIEHDNDIVVPNTEYLSNWYNTLGGNVNIHTVTPGIDIDEITSVGSRYISPETALTLAHLPEQTSGRLDVLNAGQYRGGVSNTIQLYRTMGSKANNWYFRSLYTDSENQKWTDWKQIASKSDISTVEPTIVDLGRSNSMTGDDYTKLENNENALLIYDGVVYRRSRGTNYGYDEMQFESIDDSVQTATVYITNCVVTAADEAAGVISVTDTSGLKVGMSIMFTTSGGSILAGISYRKIASIDTENKKITMDGIVIDSDTLTDGSFIAVKANATSTNLTNCVVTTADEAAGVISVTNGKSLTVGMYIDFRASSGSILSGISNRKIIAKDIANNKITVSGTVIDSDTLTSGCYITLANDIGFNKIYNRVLRIWKQKPDSTTAYVRYAYIPIGGLPVTPSKATASATSGTFTDSEWSKLQANDNNYILFNNEIYRLADKAHSGTTGIWSYTHTGWDGTNVMDKSINVTVSTGAWTLVVGQGGGEKVALTFPVGAASGTITAEQLAKLQASESNYIEMVNDKELYYLNDNGHVEGYLTYSHVGIENSKTTIKTLTITVSAKSFVIVTTVVPTESGGGKLYLHSIFFPSTTNQPLLTFYHTSPTKVTDEWIYDNLVNNTCYLTFYPTVKSIYQYGTIGLISQLTPTSSSPSWGALIDLESSGAITLSVSQALQYIVTEV